MDLKTLLGDAYMEGMTFEEAEAALKDIAPPAAPDSGDLTKLKADLAKANASAAKYKEQLRGRQSEAEAAAAAQKEEFDRLVQENADLKSPLRKSTVSRRMLSHPTRSWPIQIIYPASAPLIVVRGGG